MAQKTKWFNPSHTKDSKMVMDAALLNTLCYKYGSRIKKSNPRNEVESSYYGEVAKEKGAFGWPSTTGANNFTYNYLIYNCVSTNDLRKIYLKNAIEYY